MESKKFSAIYLEISSLCNAKCPYCITGRARKKVTKNSFINVETFSNILQTIHTKKYSKNGNIYLYVWGEPFLHPNLMRLIDCAAQYPFTYGLSTNGSILPDISKTFAKAVTSLCFSCSGFTQQSYNKIHGFNAKKIRENIAGTVHAMRELGAETNFYINYHLYQFNIDEACQMKEFANSLGIGFAANYAIINDWSLTSQWVNRALSPEDAFAIGRDIFSFHAAEVLDAAPQNYHCPQYDYLSLDTAGNICLCCQTPQTPQYTTGNILDAGADEAIAMREKSAICENCCQSGQAFLLNNSLLCPEWLRNSLRVLAYE